MIEFDRPKWILEDQDLKILRKPFFHGTNSIALKAIESYGFIRCNMPPNYHETLPNSVSLTRNYEDALVYAFDSTYPPIKDSRCDFDYKYHRSKEDTTKAIVLELCALPNVSLHRRKKFMWDHYIHQNIPWICIKRIFSYVDFKSIADSWGKPKLNEASFEILKRVSDPKS